MRSIWSGGFFSPAVTATGSRFCAGASGHVTKFVNAHGKEKARLRSTTVSPSRSVSGMRTSRPLP
nr:hypothetical protein [Cellulosimicrobium aquatile]